MPVYINDNGTWKQTTRPFIKRSSGNWSPAMEMWIKDGGVWKEGFHYDVTAPPGPELSLTVQKNSKGGQYLLVGTRLTPATNYADVALIRILVGKKGSTGTYPASPTDATYIRSADTNYPKEPWSDWYYNDYKSAYSHPDTSVLSIKHYPQTGWQTSDLAPDTYRFAAWSMDFYGNWSARTILATGVPKTGDPKQVNKRAYFQASQSGTYNLTSAGSWTPGNLQQSGGPGLRATAGVFYYGNALKDSIGQNGPATIRDVQIRLNRINDNGPTNANIYLAMATETSPGSSTGRDTSIYKLGTLAKGQAKWFTVPSALYSWMAANEPGAMILWYQDPNKAQANSDDFSVIEGINPNESTRIQGQLSIGWSENYGS